MLRMPPARDRAFRLQAGEAPSDGMRRIALSRADSALGQLREAELVDDPGACVHGARKDLKKLRAVVRLLRRELGEDLYRAESRRYRDAGRQLSATRDAEVKLETLDALAERSPDLLGSGAVGEWRERLERERAAAVADAHGGASIAIARNAVEAGHGRIAAWPLRTDSWKLVGPGVERSYRRGRKAMRGAAADPGGESLHEWRKRAKELWYHLRLLEAALPPSLAGSVERADRLAEALGVHHDLTVLREDLSGRELPTPRRPAPVEAIERRQDELAAAAFEQGEPLYARGPIAFRRKLRKGWKNWRADG
jgi:CHAD domain-containing protein